MKAFRTLLPLAAAGTVFGMLVYISIHPSRLILAAPILGGVILIVCGTLAFTGLKNNTKIMPAALPGLLVASMSFAELFVEETVLRVGLAAITATLFFILIRHLFESIRTHEFLDAVLALSEWSAVMIVFGTTAGLTAAVTFLTFSSALATLIFAVVASFVCITLARLSAAKPILYMGAAALFLTEGFYFISALPLTHWVNGAVLAILTYVFTALARGHAVERVRRTLIAAAVMAAMVLATARWR